MRVKQENSNKNPTVNSVQRDYKGWRGKAGYYSRFLLPPDIVDAQEQGSVISISMMHYFAQHGRIIAVLSILEDMLQNGTV